MLKKLFLTLCLLTPGFAPAETMAQGLDLNKIPEMFSYDLPKAEFEAKTKEYAETPMKDKFLSYKIRLPSDWTKMQVETRQNMDISQKLLGEVAKYYGPSLLDSRSFFTINASNLEYDITIKNWFVNYVLTNGYVLQGIKVESDSRIEAIYVMVKEDTTYIVRALGEINGSRIVLAQYFIPETRWEQEKTFQSEGIKSFAFTSPEEPILEERDTYAFLDLLRFDYPRSWRLLAPNIFSTEAMEAKLINSIDETTLNGEIDIYVTSTEVDTTLATEVKKIQSKLETRGFTIGEMLQNPDEFKYDDYITFSRVEVYKANYTGGAVIDHEYWIAILMEDRFFYIITMLTPSRNTEFFNWARNTQAFKVVTESFRP